MLFHQPVPCFIFFLIRKVSFLCKKNLISIFAATMGLSIILDDQLLSCVQLFGTPWTVAHQAPLLMEFPGKNTRGGCHFPLQGIFPTWGSKLHLLALAGRFFTTTPLGKPLVSWHVEKEAPRYEEVFLFLFSCPLLFSPSPFSSFSSYCGKLM